MATFMGHRQDHFTAPNIAVKLDNPVYKRQEVFLGNGHSKAELISILSRRLLQENHTAVQAANDPDSHESLRW